MRNKTCASISIEELPLFLVRNPDATTVLLRDNEGVSETVIINIIEDDIILAEDSFVMFWLAHHGYRCVIADVLKTANQVTEEFQYALTEAIRRQDKQLISMFLNYEFAPMPHTLAMCVEQKDSDTLRKLITKGTESLDEPEMKRYIRKNIDGALWFINELREMGVYKSIGLDIISNTDVLNNGWEV